MAVISGASQSVAPRVEKSLLNTFPFNANEEHDHDHAHDHDHEHDHEDNKISSTNLNPVLARQYGPGEEEIPPTEKKCIQKVNCRFEKYFDHNLIPAGDDGGGDCVGEPRAVRAQLRQEVPQELHHRVHLSPGQKTRMQQAFQEFTFNFTAGGGM